ncbi:Acetyltransferase (GNAT) family protein [Bowdeniella nasicola]|uniref:Acetyltransferase (GNAT) family protein n=1 Tax=Bowdeniella nasicola TaxID=208480 RepID=A0A1H4AC85_9ACTO|nr:GNAT family N-acetyltransferase [Bowdeniella nasicola]SEA33311.1 Acetyltransferase (GNAT) family protein [Bowdeniella nasicola]
MSGMTLRPYRREDRAAIGEVCVATGDSGADARGLYVDDELLPHIYAYPYLDFAPDLVSVIEDRGRVVGYLLGVASVDEFVSWWREHWRPVIAERYGSIEHASPADARLITLGLNPEQQLTELREDYPAEFHIDLLPDAQGQGHGRRLIDWFLGELGRRGVPGLAIGVGARNEGAIGFYRCLGFAVHQEHIGADGAPIAYTMTIDVPRKDPVQP